MNMTKEQVNAGIAAGLALTNPESDTPIPMKHASGAVILHQLLLGIASGQVQLQAVDPNAAAGKAQEKARLAGPPKTELPEEGASD